jgi:ketosteroid isomerase-like protein
MKISKCLTALLFLTFSVGVLADAHVSTDIDETVWEVVSQTVVDNDIVGMASVYHPDAVLVSQKGTYTIASTLARWGEGMEKIQSEGSKADVSFSFGHRQDTDETAFESGMFRYVLTDVAGEEQVEIIAFEALLVKKDGQWKILMERQLHEVSEADWSAQ